ncbi:MAG TPA: DUF983 domain-containing protein [Longimicrobiales bacterium]|nr:DUF983 domain-containing protein [Longimicrobiales bacterium]
MAENERIGNASRPTDAVEGAAGGAVDEAAEPSGVRMIRRGLARRCPWCGGGNLFPSWFTIRDRCPTCGLRLDRGETDFWIGAWMLNLVGVETAFTALLVTGIVILWPDVPWRAVTWTGVIGMIALPLLLFPISRTLWLAIDMTLHPKGETDFEE